MVFAIQLHQSFQQIVLTYHILKKRFGLEWLFIYLFTGLQAI